MLAHNNGTGVVAQPDTETAICTWVSDGYSFLIGFMGTGSYSGEFILYVDGDPWYRYQTSPGNRTAYVADRGVLLPAGREVILKVRHYDSSAQTFYGTILGGQ
jgi:hypothetical protein